MFKFKQFDVVQEVNAQKVGTDSMILGAWVASLNLHPINILDIGTGTGVLALMMAQTYERSSVHAIEIDQSNCTEAQYNFANSSFRDRVVGEHVSLGEFQPKVKFDLIISNPPYFSNSLKSGNIQKDVARHDSELSMMDLVEFVAANLNEEGVGAIVYPFLDEERLTALFESKGMHLVSCLRTIHKGQFIRSFMLFSKKSKLLQVEELKVRLENNDYSEEYIELTKDFHYKKL
jgi:tRNA1Val (adenine37-N6)-methyltransferase